jgi:hypothetical protein
MRYTIIAAMLVALTPVAIAQVSQGNMGGLGGMDNMPNRATMPPSGQAANRPGAENCGTPDDPKSCPPLPRHSLSYYPANRQ